MLKKIYSEVRQARSSTCLKIENWLEQEHPSYDCTSSQQHDKQQVHEEHTCLVRASAYMAMVCGAYFIGNFQSGIHVHFLKASADFQKTYGGHPGTKWRVVYMRNCTHFHPGTSFNSVIWTELKVVPG